MVKRKLILDTETTGLNFYDDRIIEIGIVELIDNVLTQNYFHEYINPKINPLEKFPIDKKVTVTAIIIPKIPNRFPCLDVSGDDKPLKARINNTPETK